MIIMVRESGPPRIAVGMAVNAPSASVVRRRITGILCGTPCFAIEDIESDSGAEKGPEERDDPSGSQPTVELIPTEDESNEDQGELESEVGVPQ
jgi:hypothetical protein